MIEWTFICMTDKVKELNAGSSAAKQGEFANWLNTFDCHDHETIQKALKADRLWGAISSLPPKA